MKSIKYVYFDSGTTNSRAYLITDGVLSDELSEKVGTLDNVMTEDHTVLEKALYGLYVKLLEKNGLKDEEIRGIFMSGMATSKNGVREIGYLPLPLSPESYAASVTYDEVPSFGRKVGFLTGIVFRPEEEGRLGNIEFFHNARGEEIELFGIMKKYPEIFRDKNVAVIMPGSHTHILFTEGMKIAAMCSSIGGELFAALREHTILKASVPVIPEILDDEGKEALLHGFRSVQKLGFNRAIYMVRTLDLFSKENDNVRGCYMEGVVNADIVNGILNYQKEHRIDSVLIAGKTIYAEIFREILKEACPGLPAASVDPDEESFALSGFLNLTAHLD